MIPRDVSYKNLTHGRFAGHRSCCHQPGFVSPTHFTGSIMLVCGFIKHIFNSILTSRSICFITNWYVWFLSWNLFLFPKSLILWIFWNLAFSEEALFKHRGSWRGSSSSFFCFYVHAVWNYIDLSSNPALLLSVQFIAVCFPHGPSPSLIILPSSCVGLCPSSPILLFLLSCFLGALLWTSTNKQYENMSKIPIPASS